MTYRERRGAHRPAGLGPAGALPWVLAVLAVIVVIAVAVHRSGGDEPVQAATTTKRPAATQSPTPSSAPTASPSATPSPSETADLSHPVSVLNGTRTSGLATSAAGRLRSAGWSVASTGNYSRGIEGTTVFYGRSSLQATAQAALSALGGAGTVQESADFGSSRITVVVGADYRR